MHVKDLLDILTQCNRFKHIPTMPIPFPLKKKWKTIHNSTHNRWH